MAIAEDTGVKGAGKITAKQARRLEQHVDWVVFPALILIVGAAAGFSLAVTVGDWEYWVDWKDRRYWPLVPTVLMIVFPAAISAVTWTKLRIPFGATFVVFSYTLLKWASIYLNFNLFAGFPMSMVWQSTFIPLAIILDATIVISGSVFVTGVVGASLWGILMYPANWIMLAGFHEPIMYNGEMVTAADLLGFEYIRTGLPEYVRLIERSTLRSFADTVVPLTAVFAAFLCIVVFYVSWAAGSFLTRQTWVKKI